ncbi:hypothetical protein [Lysinibacillus piscis]|uniref:Uncharacterized protein n=1 Tax=Lysinibacillus piscis TaxID=2518931 RepID=A0ABQ5NJY2_9BACI|nr:hypothetical protein [Lysinibacillus sp. KH24]GLC88598.1 hypothetical protein LYSBPC_17250 [Lysinibacillus sp. KH24]
MECIQLIPSSPIVQAQFNVVSINENVIGLCEVDLEKGTINCLQQRAFLENNDFRYVNAQKADAPNKKSMYLAEFDGHHSHIDFFKLNIESFVQHKFATVDLKKYFGARHLSYRTDLVYLNEDYFLFFISDLPPEYEGIPFSEEHFTFLLSTTGEHGTPYFKYVFLINSMKRDMVEMNCVLSK